MTLSMWVKRGALGSPQQSLMSSPNSGNADNFRFSTSDTLSMDFQDGAVGQLTTTQVFRDPSAWYHIVLAIDTTQATAANRAKLYVNGNQVTAFGTASYPAQNTIVTFSSVNATYLGRYGAVAQNYFDGYLTDINFIDGQALEPYYFGNNDANGVWKPIKYTGMYGLNGFYLTFGNTTSTTTLGYDSSPNGNNWTTNNISLTAGTTYDAMLDVPTNTSATVANYPTLNPLSPSSISATLSEANLKATGISTGTFESAISTMSFTSGKIYFEATCLSGTGTNASSFIGITNISNATSGACFTNSGSGSIGWDVNGTTLYTIINTTLTSRGAITPTNKVFRVAYDSSTGNIWLGYDTTWIGGGDPSTLTTPTGTLTTGVEYICGATLNTSNDSIAVNFGQRPFAQTIPTGFTALNTYNLPTPTILQGNKYMDATTYTGTGVSQTVVNQGQFKSDLIWIKQRNGTEWNILADSIRGTNKQLFSNSTNAEQTNATFLTAFASNGFTVDTSTGTNGSGSTYVGWQWQAGQGSTSSNTSGSITSTVSVNTTAGFSVVTYTGTGSSASVGHGLGVTPEFIIVKRRDTTSNWMVVSKYLTNYNWYLKLNLTDAQVGDGTIGNIDPTTSLFHIGTNAIDNASGGTYVAYVWAPIAGFSKFGSYTGNGSSDGVFVYTGFRPKYVMIKRTDSANSWYVYDSQRNTYNTSKLVIFAESSSAEATSTTSDIDFVSNGFKIRGADSGINASGGSYIIACFAENPFKNSNAR
jgi:hypothetical protein